MGTWGAGAFENDGAADWAAGLGEAGDVKKAIARVGKGRIDLDDAIEAMAAEVVAAARGTGVCRREWNCGCMRAQGLEDVRVGDSRMTAAGAGRLKALMARAKVYAD